MAKNLPAMQETRETWILSLGQEDLEEHMATHSSVLAWRIPWTEDPGGLQSLGCIESDTTEHTAAQVYVPWATQPHSQLWLPLC